MLHKEKKKALNDNTIEVTNLCEVIEAVLRHQQKGLYIVTSCVVIVYIIYLEHVSFWGDRHDYWNYLTSNVGSMKQLNDVVKKVQSLTQVRSCDHCYHDYLWHITDNDGTG